MKTMIWGAAAALLFTTAAPAMAQTYRSDMRQYRQQERIERGYRSGRLTPREAVRLQRQQHRINRVERRARAYNNGYVDPRSRRQIERMQNRASHNIARKANNHRYGY